MNNSGISSMDALEHFKSYHSRSLSSSNIRPQLGQVVVSSSFALLYSDDILPHSIFERDIASQKRTLTDSF